MHTQTLPPQRAASGVTPEKNKSGTLGIIAGGGRLPAQLIENCRLSGRSIFVLALEGNADMAAIAPTPHAVIRLGAVGEALEHLHQAQVTELVLAGHVRRPSLASLRPDKMGAKLLARLGGAFFSGDDTLLKAVIRFLEEEGFNVIGSDEVLAGLLAPASILGAVTPDKQAMDDITHGMKIAKALGALDIGQAVMIENGYVLGVEAAEGTDALIARCALLRRDTQGGVLVKAKKPSQEGRADLPAIGPATVEKIHHAGFAGIAVEAGGSIILDLAQTVARADALGIFLVGV